MSNYYITSDWHFNHASMVDYCDRPDDFEEKIVNGLRSLPQDKSAVLIFLGDICIGGDMEVHEKYIVPLNCTKILVRGNHDRKSNSWYLQHGWDFVARQITDRIYGKTIIFSHMPVEIGGCDLNIHGHFHNTDHRRYDPELSKIITGKHRLICLEDMEYRPVELRKVVEGKI